METNLGSVGAETRGARAGHDAVLKLCHLLFHKLLYRIVHTFALFIDGDGEGIDVVCGAGAAITNVFAMKWHLVVRFAP